MTVARFDFKGADQALILAVRRIARTGRPPEEAMALVGYSGDRASFTNGCRSNWNIRFQRPTARSRGST